ncbi:hypothetical protein L1987_66295 [Smallanthus sonchifolius]|uniref:Uncharacterized protein n=1 Tax=Smallanthus sonchifolius TaxID=185202 RepID=A0ACB9BX15_9ASTR|nr:hypothetical protein L1987_66295 [Smallanthus sonchifolius]
MDVASDAKETAKDDGSVKTYEAMKKAMQPTDAYDMASDKAGEAKVSFNVNVKTQKFKLLIHMVELKKKASDASGNAYDAAKAKVDDSSLSKDSMKEQVKETYEVDKEKAMLRGI